MKYKFKCGGKAVLSLNVFIIDRAITRFGAEYYVRESDGDARWVWECELSPAPAGEPKEE